MLRNKLPRYGSLTEKVLDEKDRHITSLRVMLGLSLCLSAFMGYGWNNAPTDIRVHIPPDLRAGSTRFVNEIDDFNVYNFGIMLFQRINRWQKNGKEDYWGNIHAYRSYMSDDFFKFLLDDFNEKSGLRELEGRSRFLQEIPGYGFNANRVVVEAKNSWIVYLDVQIVENYAGGVVKDVYMRYPLHIVYHDVDPDQNPWGLMISGFADKPKRIVYSGPDSEKPNN